MKSNRRDSNIELLRIILMIMIILGHFFVHGKDMKQISDNDSNYFSLYDIYLMPLLYYHVDTFIFISGYFGMKISKVKVINFLIMTSFYGIISYFSYLFIYYKTEMTYHISGDILRFFFPLSSDIWWFMTNYFFLMLLSPIINRGIESIDISKTQNHLILLFVFSFSGLAYFFENHNYSFVFIGMYIIGRILKQKQDNIIKRKSVIIYLCSLLGLLLHLSILIFLCNDNPISAMYKTMRYGHPLIILAAISFFYSFQKIKIGYNKIINVIASGTLAAYLLTDGPANASINHKIIQTFGDNWFVLLIIATFCVLLSSLFEHFRKYLFKVTR